MTEGCRLGRRQREADQRRKTEFVSHAALRRRRGRFGRSHTGRPITAAPTACIPDPEDTAETHHSTLSTASAALAIQTAAIRRRPGSSHASPSGRPPAAREQPALRPRRRSAERRRSRPAARRVRAIPPRATPQPCAAAVRPRPSGQGGAPPDSGAARENPECPCQDAAMPRLSLYVLEGEASRSAETSPVFPTAVRETSFPGLAGPHPCCLPANSPVHGHAADRDGRRRPRCANTPSPRPGGGRLPPMPADGALVTLGTAR